MSQSTIPRPHDAGAAALHDPAGRELIVALGAWDVRWPPGGDFGLAWALAGLWHVQLWHRQRRVSVLVFHQSRWMEGLDVHIPGVGRLAVRSARELYPLFEAQAITPPAFERVQRLSPVAFARTLTAIGARALGAMSCAAHRPLLASC